MQTLIDKFGMNATYLIAAVAALVVLLMLFLLIRALFGARIRTASGRSRQPRLGVVDAFDLDRQRQLVLVRRDNVEHLVMIGGPNDMLIESTIIRAPGGAEVRSRAQPTFEEPPAPSAPAQRPAPAPVTAPSIDDLVQAVTPPPPPPPPARPVPVPPPVATRADPPPPPPPPPPSPPVQLAPGPQVPAPLPRSVPTADISPPPPPPPPPPAATPRPVPQPPVPEPRPATGAEPVPPPPPSEQPKRRFDFGRLVASRQPDPARTGDSAPPSAPNVQVPGAPLPPPPPPPPQQAGPVREGPAPAAGGPGPAKAVSGSIDALEQEMAKLLGRPQGGS